MSDAKWRDTQKYKTTLEDLKVKQIAMGTMMLKLEDAEKEFMATLPEKVETIGESMEIVADGRKLGYKIDLIPNGDGFLIKFTAPRLAYVEFE